ncbi:MAG: oligoribonuclease [Frankiaceae bacterium]|nr:oligoribonuclease [Frankiaceae bacterium]
MSDRLVWIDCEMTGLDLGSDLLIEVAALVTDGDLNILGEGVDVVIGATADEMARMPDVVRDMHASSGLTDEVVTSTVSVKDAEQQVLAYIKEWVPEAKKAPLCGNSIATDRGFLTRDMPELDEWLHYRMVDVSSVKELARRWYPRAYFGSPKKGGGHRALADIKESVLELQYYREAVFVAAPGPSSEEANAIATRLLGGDPDGASRLPEPSEQVPD